MIKQIASMSHSGKSLSYRTLVGVIGWTLYSGQYGLSLLMLQSWQERRYSVVGVQALQKKMSLGS